MLIGDGPPLPREAALKALKMRVIIIDRTIAAKKAANEWKKNSIIKGNANGIPKPLRICLRCGRFEYHMTCWSFLDGTAKHIDFF